MSDLTFTKQEILHLYMLHAAAFRASIDIPNEAKSVFNQVAKDIGFAYDLLTIEQMDELGKKMSMLLESWK